MIREYIDYQLKEFREELGLTQAELAEKIGVGQNRVSQIENGNLEQARVSTLQRYVEALGGTLQVTIRQGNGRELRLLG